MTPSVSSHAGESLVKQDSKQVQVDLQDLGMRPSAEVRMRLSGRRAPVPVGTQGKGSPGLPGVGLHI